MTDYGKVPPCLRCQSNEHVVELPREEELKDKGVLPVPYYCNSCGLKWGYEANAPSRLRFEDGHIEYRDGQGNPMTLEQFDEWCKSRGLVA
jgi:hypothetical protein